MIRKFFLLLILLCVVAAIFFVVRYEAVIDFFVARELPRATVLINDNRINVEIAASELERAKGLSGRDGLGADEGMLFLFEKPEVYTFWMKDMKFSIDIIWILDGVVVDYDTFVPVPGQDVSLSDLKRYAPDTRINAVLEVNAGYVEEYDIEIGDRVNVIYSEEEAKLI